jgi:starch phosphorylase
VAFDTPIVGWRGKRVNTLRLWARSRSIRSCSTSSTPATTSARSREQLARRAHHARALSGGFDAGGQELRLRQEFFFSSASLQDIVRRTCSNMATSARCPTRSRSSSTTRIRRSRSPN